MITRAQEGKQVRFSRYNDPVIERIVNRGLEEDDPRYGIVTCNAILDDIDGNLYRAAITTYRGYRITEYVDNLEPLNE